MQIITVLTFFFVTNIMSCSEIHSFDDSSKIAKGTTTVSTRSINDINNYSIFKTNTDNAYNKSVTRIKRDGVKKWQVGRVSRKHYEIINMLWRKTKVFLDIESTTAKVRSFKNSTAMKNYYKSNNIFTKNIQDKQGSTKGAHSMHLSTPSYIEFYYLDEIDDRFKRTDTTTTLKFITKNRDNNRFILKNSGLKLRPANSFFAFHDNNKSYKRSSHLNANKGTIIAKIRAKIHKSTTKKTNVQKPVLGVNKSSGTEKYLMKSSLVDMFFDNETCPLTTTPDSTPEYLTSPEPTIMKNQSLLKNESRGLNTESTVPYDKIRFFEIHDRLTPIAYHSEKKTTKYDDKLEFLSKSIEDNNIGNDHELLKKHINENIGYFNVYNRKRYIKRYEDDYRNITNFTNAYALKSTTTKVSSEKEVKKLEKSSVLVTIPKKITPNTNASVAPWIKYPFVAVYVNEPSQIHCDAAGISPHWLVAAAACLSRHRKNPSSRGISAYVAYCGENWQVPERRAYVKYSLVHPRYHPRDKIRRHLYNIGVIQVVTSMLSACFNWSPVTLMSHQFAADPAGSFVSAVGWGLDRYDSSNTVSHLPKWPLMVYEGLVFSNSCPGNNEYRKSKLQNEEIGVKNIYCLSLPPYSGEQNDPVHGGLLLHGGKLIALYLQEERRPWGDQSAQYTGVWRLIPWVLDIAREPEESDSIPVEI